MSLQLPNAAPARETTGRSWCFTLNNYTPQQEAMIQDWSVTYLVYGREISSTGTPHLQGCVTFSAPIRLTGAKKLLPTAHWEKAMALGNARNYCMKEGNYFTKGSLNQGKRTDLEEATNTLFEKGIAETARQHPTTYVKFHGGLNALSFMVSVGKKEEWRNVEVHWLYGPTGSGKSRGCHRVSDDDVWCSAVGMGMKWFDGYYGQKDVIFDDVREGHIPFAEWLRLLDGYKTTVSVKGGMTAWRPERIFITSPKHPRDQLANEFEAMDQLMRRIDHVWQFPEEANAFDDFFQVDEVPGTPIDAEEPMEILSSPPVSPTVHFTPIEDFDEFEEQWNEAQVAEFIDLT